MPAERGGMERQNQGTPSFLRQLSAANSGKGYWSAGWDVHAVHGGVVTVRGADVVLLVGSNDCLIPRDSVIEPGMPVGLRFPKELFSISPGFYVAMGDNELVGDNSYPLVRLYWNLTAEGSIQFVRKATLALNRAELAFKIKTVNDPVRFTRCDAVVLYIRKTDYPKISKVMERIYPQISAYLKNAEPAFTKRLTAGVGLAEDPGNGESFGSHRCQILAEAMVQAYEQGEKSLLGQLQVVRKCFGENGIDIEKPFVNAATVDEYDFRPPLHSVSRQTRVARAAESGADVLLHAAAEIGRRLLRATVWHNGLCNWMGMSEGGARLEIARAARTYSALGFDLYSGSSGVALFLSELYSSTGSDRARECALGAIGQALSRFDPTESHAPWGLYTGGMGIALATAYVGKALHEDQLLERAAGILQNFSNPGQLEGEFDFIFGKAGGVTALLLLRDLLGNESLLERAIELGDDLLRSAEKSGIGYSWRSPRVPCRRNLTGLAHGTAGVGFALMELFQATGNSHYRDGADRAFQYEDHWFDKEARNWQDFREEPGGSKRTKLPLRFSTSWCHGAPGIALSRLRAFEIVKDPKYKEVAITALQTTGRITRAWLHSGTSGYSLCHGLCGNAEILLDGSRVLGKEFAEGVAIADAVASLLLANTSKLDGTVDSGDSPGLMLGLAGRGHFYLHLNNPATRSILSMVVPLRK